MNEMMRFPAVVFVLSFSAMWLSAWTGLYLRSTKRKLEESTHKDLDLIVSATLTLLGLIIGFSFSMAISRYDQRKNCEEAEANAISTEYVRAELLPAADAAKVRALLRSYLNERILFYVTRDNEALQQIDAKTAATADWNVVGSAVPRHGAAESGFRSGTFRHERCVEFTGIHASRLVESNPTWSLVVDGGRGDLRESINRI